MATVARIRELLQLLKFVSAQCAPPPPPTPHPTPCFPSVLRSLAGNSCRLTKVRLEPPQEQCYLYPFVQVCAVLFCVHTLVHACQCLGCLTCVQILLLHVIAHGGRTSAIRESSLKVDSVEKKKIFRGMRVTSVTAHVAGK